MCCLRIHIPCPALILYAPWLTLYVCIPNEWCSCEVWRKSNRLKQNRSIIICRWWRSLCKLWIGTYRSFGICDQTFISFRFTMGYSKIENMSITVPEEVEAKKSLFQLMIMASIMYELVSAGVMALWAIIHFLHLRISPDFSRQCLDKRIHLDL